MVGFSMSNPPVEDCIPADENSHTIGTVAFARRRQPVRVERRRLELHQRGSARAARAEPRQPRRARSCASTPTPRWACPTIRSTSPRSPGATARRSGRAACGIPSASTIHPLTNDAIRRRRRLEQLGRDRHRQGRQLRLALLRGRRAERRPRAGSPRASGSPATRRRASTSAACAALYAQGLGAVKPPDVRVRPRHRRLRSPRAAPPRRPARSTRARPIRRRTGTRSSSPTTARRWIRYLTFDAQGVATVANFAKETSDGIAAGAPGPRHQPLLRDLQRNGESGAPHPLHRGRQHAAHGRCPRRARARARCRSPSRSRRSAASTPTRSRSPSPGISTTAPPRRSRIPRTPTPRPAPTPPRSP